MDLIITSATPLSIGGPSVINIYGQLIQNAYSNPSTGGLTVPCSLKWYYSEADFAAGKKPVFPLDESGAEINAVTFDLTAEQAAQAGLPYVFHVVAAATIMAANPNMVITTHV